jgi:5-amino-6-(5-phosphoribosylamino)uracil reductase
MIRPHTIVVLAMTADGKIADRQRSAARFSSATDKAHLEKQIALVDGVLFGAGTLRAYGTTLSVSDRELLTLRAQQKKAPQPIQIVASASAKIESNLRFFRQNVPRCLLTTAKGASLWQDNSFDRLVVAKEELSESGFKIDWMDALAQLKKLGLHTLAILGGGELVASLLEIDAIDEFLLTICPTIFGGAIAPTPVGGVGFLEQQARQLELLTVERVGDELFLHYRVRHACTLDIQ